MKLQYLLTFMYLLSFLISIIPTQRIVSLCRNSVCGCVLFIINNKLITLMIKVIPSFILWIFTSFSSIGSTPENSVSSLRIFHAAFGTFSVIP
uniref:Secreted protein n=1 Tax=Schistosoma curassoni TaxID=6186 RepID=A0A183JCM3_9TREM